MTEEFLEILKCPYTGSNLELITEKKSLNGMIEKGLLINSDGSRKYPIVNYIPRFVDEECYSANFGFEWRKWPKIQFDSENIGRPMAGATLSMFKKITHFPINDLKNKMVVEFGCGAGRFLDIIQNSGGIAVGIDMSLAVEPARENFKDNKNILIVQGDILNPPFKNGIFDYGFSIGAFHHTPQPGKAFNKLAATIKKNGAVACVVYPQDGEYNFPSVHIYRRAILLIAKVFGSRISEKIALFYSYFSASVLYYIFSIIKKLPIANYSVAAILRKYLFVIIDMPDRRWRILDAYDAITPTYASVHSRDEVESWFVEAGLNNIKKTDWGSTSFVGYK